MRRQAKRTRIRQRKEVMYIDLQGVIVCDQQVALVHFLRLIACIILEQNKQMALRPPTPKGLEIKIENIYTQESEGGSQDSIEFTGGFQFQPLSPKMRPTPKIKIEIPAKEKGKIDASNKLTINLTQSRDFGTADNAAPKSERKPQPILDSIVDIRTSMHSIEEEEGQSLFHSFSKANQKSMNALSSKQTEHTLQKSDTMPTISQPQRNGGFEIRTNLVKDNGQFKKQKNVRAEDKNKTISFLTATSSQVQTQMRNKLAASRVINDNRITLRDYMFMANTSSRKAAEMKRIEFQQSKGAGDIKKVLKTQPALQNTPKPNIQPRVLRERYHKQKYHISNGQMGDVLKTSIRAEISQLTKKVESINRWMDVHSKVDNQELIQLYNMRNDLITYNKKFQESVNKLTAADHEFFSSAIRQASLEQLDSNSAIKQISLEQLDSKPEQKEDSEILQLAEI